mmetsp:Transcript_5328/g.7853  ORF Transcript_5328/g.7853 Transcript_5328/m.7853 type:complete len:164 (+) Transcript_5328:744-1235(+)
MCRFLHDPGSRRVCPRFLNNTCKLGDKCPLLHTRKRREDMPVCKKYLAGTCFDENCPYSHVRVNSQAPICQAFLNGHCPKGEACTFKHVLWNRKQSSIKAREVKVSRLSPKRKESKVEVMREKKTMKGLKIMPQFSSSISSRDSNLVVNHVQPRFALIDSSNL